VSGAAELKIVRRFFKMNLIFCKTAARIETKKDARISTVLEVVLPNIICD
jgi:hypothetical protein